MTLNHLTYIFKHFVKNERCLQQTKALTQLARVSEFHSEGSRFESCMQTRHLEKGTDSNHIAPGLLALLPISHLKCLALPGDTQVGEESSLLSCQAG